MSEELRALAREARNLMDGGWWNAPFLRAFIDDDDAPVFEEADAAYIAAANPTVILGLLDRIAELEEGLGEAARDAHALAVRELASTTCYGPFETCPSPYCAKFRLTAARSSSKVETNG